MNDIAIEVLIVEDDKAMAALIQEELEDEGYQTRVVHNGAAAIEAVQKSPPDVVVLDINMPGKDGIETLSEMVNLNANLPVILHTAYSAYKENYMTWAAVEYVVKASDFKDLKNAIARLAKQAAHEKS